MAVIACRKIKQLRTGTETEAEAEAETETENTKMQSKLPMPVGAPTSYSAKQRPQKPNKNGKEIALHAKNENEMKC